MEPFDEDQFVVAQAERHGLSVYRRAVIDIDAELLPSTYYRRTPDYRKIRAALDQQIPVPGATLTNRVTFVLSPKETNGEDEEGS